MDPRAIRRATFLFLTALGLAVLFSCGTVREAPFAAQDTEPATPSTPPQHADTLPTVTDVALKVGVRRSSFTEEGLRREGSAYDTELRAQRVTKAGSFATFSPALDGDNDSFTDMSLCFYVFDLSAYDRDPTLRMQWDTPPSAGSLWVALADLASNSWQFFQADEPALNVGDFAPYAQLEGRLIVALIVMGNQPAVLSEVRVGSLPPTAAFEADTLLGPPPLTVKFDASASADPDGAVVSYDWDFDGDGTFEFNSGGDPTASHSYDVPGDYAARVQVTDDAGVSANASLAAPLHVIAPPVAALSADPVVGINPQEVDFDSNGSTDPEGTITKYEWDYDGDGTFDADTGTTPTVTYEYTVFGSYSATVRVTSSTGAVDTQAVPISINESWMLPPDAQLQADITEGNGPLIVNFDASGSTDPDGVIDKFEWDYDGDGVFDEDTGTTPTASHTYSEPGDYSATVRVTDNIEASDLATVQIHANFPPVADLTAAETFGDAPFTVEFDASGSSDTENGIESYEWDWNNDGTYDDNSGNDPTESHTYNVPGIYTCKVRVTDDDGLSSTDTLLIDSNAHPSAVVSHSADNYDAPESISFDGADSAELGGAIVKYEWDWTNDGTYDYSSTFFASAHHVYSTADTITAKLRVTDDDGETATATTTFTLTRVLLWIYGSPYSRGNSNYFGNHIAIEAIGGKPVVLYFYLNQNNNLNFSRMTGTDPFLSFDWKLCGGITNGYYADFGAFDVDVSSTKGGLTRPTAAWSHYDDGLFFGQATSSAPNSVSDWPSHRVEAAAEADYPSLTSQGSLTSSKPMISYYLGDGSHDLRFARASVTGPNDAGDWDKSTVDSTGLVGKWSSLAIVHGKPAISYYDSSNDDQKYARANDATPSESSDWTKHMMGFSGGRSGLLQVGEVPMIVWYDSQQGDLECARGKVAEPNSLTDWTYHSIETTGDVGDFPTLALYEGRPLVTYYNRTTQRHVYAWAKSSNPGSAADWVIRDIAYNNRNVGLPIEVIGNKVYGAKYGTGGDKITIFVGQAP
jgi:PKD repeat protein